MRGSTLGDKPIFRVLNGIPPIPPRPTIGNPKAPFLYHETKKKLLKTDLLRYQPTRLNNGAV